METGAISANRYQERVREIVPARFRLPRVFTALALVEELGELVAEVIAGGSSSRAASSIAGELGDMLFSCAEIGNEYDFPVGVGAIAGGDAGRPASAPVMLDDLVVLAGKVAKAVLEIECFEKRSRGELAAATQALFAALTRISTEWHLDPTAAMDLSLAKMEKRIATGKWEAQYGDALVRKQLKHN